MTAVYGRLEEAIKCVFDAELVQGDARKGISMHSVGCTKYRFVGQYDTGTFS